MKIILAGGEVFNPEAIADKPVAKIELYYLDNYYGWCVAAYDEDGNMHEDFNPEYYGTKGAAKGAAHKAAGEYEVPMIWYTKAGKAQQPALQYCKGEK